MCLSLFAVRTTIGNEIVFSRKRKVFLYGDEDTIRKRLYAMHDAGVYEIVAVISPLKDLAREAQVGLEILASI